MKTITASKYENWAVPVELTLTITDEQWNKAVRRCEMKTFTITRTIWNSWTIEANSQEEAEEKLEEIMDNMDDYEDEATFDEDWSVEEV